MAIEARLVGIDEDGFARTKNLATGEETTGLVYVKAGGLLVFAAKRAAPTQSKQEADEAVVEEEVRRRRMAVSLPRDVRGVLVGFDEEGRAKLVDRDHPEAIRLGIVLQNTGGRLTWAPSSDRPLTVRGAEVLQVAPGAPGAAAESAAGRDDVQRLVREAIANMSPEEATALARSKGLRIADESPGDVAAPEPPDSSLGSDTLGGGPDGESDAEKGPRKRSRVKAAE
jgi:hypothetical protein